MGKPFLTIEEQVSLLERRGMRTSPDTGRVLMAEGYYSVVNGYKSPFIDEAATREAGDDRYAPGSTFDDLYALFSFDRELRGITFSHLIKSEAIVRTSVAYCFSERHREADAYLDQSNFATKDEYEAGGGDPARYREELQGLMSILLRRSTRSEAEFVRHYRERHGSVPLWVLANDLTFGNLEHFFNLMRPSEQRDVCKSVASATGRLGDRRLGFFSVEKARVGIEAMVKFRNICAHDERLYCARVGGRKDINFEKLVWFMERYLTRDDFLVLIREVVRVCKSYMAKSDKVTELFDGLGISGLMRGALELIGGEKGGH